MANKNRKQPHPPIPAILQPTNHHSMPKILKSAKSASSVDKPPIPTPQPTQPAHLKGKLLNLPSCSPCPSWFHSFPPHENKPPSIPRSASTLHYLLLTCSPVLLIHCSNPVRNARRVIPVDGPPKQRRKTKPKHPQRQTKKAKKNEKTHPTRPKSTPTNPFLQRAKLTSKN